MDAGPDTGHGTGHETWPAVTWAPTARKGHSLAAMICFAASSPPDFAAQTVRAGDIMVCTIREPTDTTAVRSSSLSLKGTPDG